MSGLWRAPWLAVALVLVGGCASLPRAPRLPCHRIPVGPGPEDAVLDDAHDRLLVASHDRRARTPAGEIYAVDLSRERAIILERRGEPRDLVLRPHGLDLVTRDNGDLELLVVTHGARDPDTDWHAIVRYRVEADHLAFVAVHHDRLLVSPNDVVGLPDGSFYASNDASSHGNFLELALGLKGGSIAHLDSRGRWQIAADELAYPNGVAIVGDELWVSTTREHRLYAFAIAPSGQLRRRGVVAEIPGGDNFTVYDDTVLVTSHPSALAFVGHASDGSSLSPSVVYRVRLSSETARVIYADSGAQISAASTALMARRRLYIAQVFEPFLLVCQP